MSGKIMGMTMRAKLPASAKAVLLVYAYHANDEDQLAWPSVETITEMSGLAERAVQKWTHHLREEQLLIPAGTDGHKSRAYRVNLPRLAELAIKKPAPGAPLPEEKPAPGAPLPQGAEIKPAPGAQKPAPDAPQEEKPAPGAEKPAPGAPETDIKQPFKSNSIKHQESHDAAADEPPPIRTPKIPTTEADAERVWTDVTGMITIPGDLATQDACRAAILNLAAKHRENTTAFLRPYWQAMKLAKNKNQRSYSRTSPFWLTTWAVAEEIPELVLSQIRGLPDIPPELADWLKQAAPTGPAMVQAGGKGLSQQELEQYGQEELQKLLARRKVK